MLLCLLVTQMEYISTFQSRPFSSRRRALAKIQHHEHMARTTCNNRKDIEGKIKCQLKLRHVKNKSIKQIINKLTNQYVDTPMSRTTHCGV